MKKVYVFVTIALIAIATIVVVTKTNKNQNNSTNIAISLPLDTDSDGFITALDNATLGVMVNDIYPEIIVQKPLKPKELRKAILKVIPERVTVKQLKITKKVVILSGLLPEHAEMDILLEKLKTISALQRFDTPSLKPNDGGGVTFTLRIFLTIELTWTDFKDGPEGANYQISLSDSDNDAFINPLNNALVISVVPAKPKYQKFPWSYKGGTNCYDCDGGPIEPIDPPQLWQSDRYQK
ncbi:MAG: hypothetical protein NTX00_02660 [Candidatus Parcubacteria bacterium]|nr:hypothetical protein [Candidatus Parcubacteria bacterium]